MICFARVFYAVPCGHVVPRASPVVEPRSGLLIPPGLRHTKKGPYLRTGLSLNMAVRGGLTRCARPAGDVPCGHVVPLASPWSNPGRGFSSPWLDTYEKGPYLRTGLSLNMAVRGGLTRCARPAGDVPCGHVVPRDSPVVEPRSGLLIPPGLRHTKKARTCVRAFPRNMAVRGGFEPPIRCRIHTFQACSFSHSDTSPYCLPVISGTGANVGKSACGVNQLFALLRVFNQTSSNLILKTAN